MWPIALTGTALALLTASMPVVEAWWIGLGLAVALVVAAAGEALVLETVERIRCVVVLGRAVSAADALGAAARGAATWTLGGGLETAAGTLRAD